MSNIFLSFSNYDISSIIENQEQRVTSNINSQSDDYILNVNKDEYIAHLVSEFTITPLEIHTDQLTVSTYEAKIPAAHHPSNYHTEPGKSYLKNVIKYHIPFSGDPNLLKTRASSYALSLPRITIEDKCICFEIINFNFTADKIKQSADDTVNSIVNQNGNTSKDLNSFNSRIESIANQTFDARKKQLLKKNDLMSSLGVPVRKANDTPEIFSIPVKRTKVILTKSKPVVTEKGYKPEPAMDDTIYLQILDVIHGVGKQFERLPSTYSGKEEEHLRDHMLLILEPNFEGSSTGETFNKNGKTDILMRHESSNVFIAELKYWRGKKSFLDTISQLLGYLTWRDSKAAVIIFVKNKEFSPVLKTVKETAIEHSNYFRFCSEQEEGWYHYKFHINEDQNREVKLAVMLFHIPG